MDGLEEFDGWWRGIQREVSAIFQANKSRASYPEVAMAAVVSLALLGAPPHTP